MVFGALKRHPNKEIAKTLRPYRIQFAARRHTRARDGKHTHDANDLYRGICSRFSCRLFVLRVVFPSGDASIRLFFFLFFFFSSGQIGLMYVIRHDDKNITKSMFDLLSECDQKDGRAYGVRSMALGTLRFFLCQ